MSVSLCVCPPANALEWLCIATVWVWGFLFFHMDPQELNSCHRLGGKHFNPLNRIVDPEFLSFFFLNLLQLMVKAQLSSSRVYVLQDLSLHALQQVIDGADVGVSQRKNLEVCLGGSWAGQSDSWDHSPLVSCRASSPMPTVRDGSSFPRPRFGCHHDPIDITWFQDRCKNSS